MKNISTRVFSIAFSLFIAVSLWAVDPNTTLSTYYKNIDGKSNTNDALRTQLCTIISTGYTSIGYSSLPDQVYAASTDPSDFYNGSSKTMEDIYSSYPYVAGDAKASATTCGEGWNKEHTVPQSWFNESSPMKSDAHHVFPTDIKMNSDRSSYPYGETDAAKGCEEYGYGRKGASKLSSYDGTVYEPGDDYKGDLARVYFYMATRYRTTNFTSGTGNTSFTYTSGVADLTDYMKNLMLKWHRNDPVSEKELKRNNAIYTHQKNRNPFVDYPCLVEYVWGDKAGEAVDLSSLVSGYDGVGTDCCANPDDPNITVSATSVTLDKTNNGATSTKTFTITGANLTDGISIAKTGSAYITVSPTTISAANANSTQTITVTYKPKAEGTHTATLTISSTGANNKTVAISGTCTTVYTATWMADGANVGSSTAESGESPDVPSDPVDCSEDRVFKGWTSDATYTSEDGAGLFTTTAPAIADNTTFYAVYADKEGSGSGSSDEFELYSGDLTEGDYIIYYSGKAMNSTVSSNRLGYTEVETSEDKITTTDAAIIWHIAASGNYWTIYNAGEAQYAAATGTKNQAGLNADGTDDKSLWTASGSSTYEFVNKNNAANSINANLRNNGTYGFACYATSTGGALSLYKAAASASYSNYSIECTSTPKVTITFHANNGSGETTTQQVPQGLSRALNANTFAYEHHAFLGWATTETGEKEYDNKQTINISADLDLYAVWQEHPQFTATFMNNGVLYATRTGYAGETFAEAVTDPEPCKEDFTFVGWITTTIAEATTINPSAKAVTTYPAEATTYHAVYRWSEGGGDSGSSGTAEFAPSDFSDQGTSGTGSEISATVNGVTFACDKGFGTTQIRCYKDGTITISSENTITAIEFTFSGSYTGGMNTSYTDLSTNSWTQTLASQARITALTVTYGGGTSTTYYSTSPDCGTPCVKTITITSNNDTWGTVSFVE